jgi:hypothetical protein
MTKLRLALLALAFAALPAAAHAQGGWWDTIEEWSGPGPFSNGGVIDVRLGCFTDKPGSAWVWLAHEDATSKEHPCFTKPETVTGYIDVRYVRATTADDQPLFRDRPAELRGKLTAHAFQVLAMHKVAIPAVAIGAGIGFIALDGPNLDKSVHSWTLTPFSVSVTPLRLLGADARWKRVITFNFEEIAVLGTFKATDFNSTSTSSFSAATELHRSYSLVVDVLALLK